MANWKTDDELDDIAEKAAKKMIEAMQNEDLDVGEQIGGDGSGLTDIAKSFAKDCTTLDPAALAEEYERVQRLAGLTGDESSVLDDLRLTTKLLGNWHGDASDEFHKQVTRTEGFMTSQSNTLGRAVQGLDAAYMVNVTARQSFYDIAVQTIEACDAAIGAYDAKEKKAVLAALTEIPKAIFDFAVGRSLTAGVGTLYTIGKNSYELVSLSGDAMKVVNGFGKYMGELHDHYEDGLNGVAKKINDAADAMREKELELLEPLPAKFTDIHSPDFSYENFFSDERDVDSFGAEVDKEAKDSPEDKDEEDSDITRALDGEGDKAAD